MNTYQNKEARRYLVITSLLSLLAVGVMTAVTVCQWQLLTHGDNHLSSDYADIYELLARYDLEENIIFVADVQQTARWMTLINVLILGGVLFIIHLCFYRYLKERQKQLNILSGYIEQISMGKYVLDLADNSEDELSNLKNELYKVTISLKEQARTSREQKRALADSVSDISHQLKTPLTSISVLLDNLKENEEMDEAIRRRFLQEISRQISSVNWMITMMLKLSRLDAGVVKFENKRMDVTELLQEVMDNLEILAELKRVQLRLDTEKQPIWMQGDYNWNREALTNLVKNAIEHSYEGTEVLIRAETNEVYTKITVTNQGETILPEEQRHIFERFYRASNAAKNSVGIGLALVKSIITQQNGYVTVESGGNETSFAVKYMKK